jgi:hypothetical protein
MADAPVKIRWPQGRDSSTPILGHQQHPQQPWLHPIHMHEADKVVWWLLTGDGYKTEPISYLKPRCDASGPDWQTVFQEWQDRKRLCIWLCEPCAIETGILW